MRTPVVWFLGWITIAATVFLIWPEQRLLVSAFWFGWAAAIIGQDIADWLKQKSTHEKAEKIGIWLVRTRFMRRYSVGTLYFQHRRGV